jgi:long-chain fatty acid transport protein
MINPKKSVVALAVATAMAFPATAMATNGYFGSGYGVKSKGMAGAGVAMPLDSMDATNNPANMVHVGTQLDVGVTWFSPRRSYSVDQVGPFLTPDTGAFSLIPNMEFDSENENFLVPNFGFNYMIDDVSSVGITVAGNGGMNTEYPNVTAPGFPTGTYYAGTAGVDLMQLATLLTYARKMNEMVSVGISGIFAFARFKATGLGSFARGSTDPANLTNNGYETSTGFGLKAGITADVSDQVTLGASYQSKIDMSEFDDYAGLFAEAGDFDVPSTWSAGITLRPADQHAILFDYQRINYTDTASISNPLMPNFMMCQMGDFTSCLGGSNGPGFGWEDINVYRIGYQYDAGDWQARFGFSTNDQPVPDSETLFNIIAPGVVKNHWTAGFTKKVSDNGSIDLSFMYAPSVEVSGGNPLAAIPGVGDTQIINIEMEQFEAGVNYTHRF